MEIVKWIAVGETLEWSSQREVERKLSGVKCEADWNRMWKELSGEVKWS